MTASFHILAWPPRFRVRLARLKCRERRSAQFPCMKLQGAQKTKSTSLVT